MIGVFGACSSDAKTSAAKEAQTDTRVKAANAKRATATARKKQHARAAQLAARRRAFAAAVRKKKRTTAVLTSANVTPADDLAAVQRTVRSINRAFKLGVAAGISRSLAANYWVATGDYSGRQCAAFERKLGLGIVSEAVFVGRRTFRPSPGWVDPVIGRVPSGRIYSFRISTIQTQVRSGEHRKRTSVIHATVRGGRAHLFFRCE